MAADCPVITTDVPAVNEIVRDGENGLLAPYDDPQGLAATICRLLDAPDLRARVIEGGRATLRGPFDPDTLFERVLRVYERVQEPVR